MELYVCPVRLFTPEIEGWLSLFGLTHRVRVASGRAWWERTSLPSAGGIGDQSSRVLEALDWIRRVADDVLATRLATRAAARGHA